MINMTVKKKRVHILCVFTTSPAKAASWLCYKNGAELTFSEYCTIKWHFSCWCALFITEVISGCKTGALTPFMSCCQMIHKLCWACNLLKCEHFSCWNVQHHSSVLNYSIPEGGNHVVTLVILIWPQKKEKKVGGKGERTEWRHKSLTNMKKNCIVVPANFFTNTLAL